MLNIQQLADIILHNDTETLNHEKKLGLTAVFWICFCWVIHALDTRSKRVNKILSKASKLGSNSRCCMPHMVKETKYNSSLKFCPWNTHEPSETWPKLCRLSRSEQNCPKTDIDNLVLDHVLSRRCFNLHLQLLLSISSHVRNSGHFAARGI